MPENLNAYFQTILSHQYVLAVIMIIIMTGYWVYSISTNRNIIKKEEEGVKEREKLLRDKESRMRQMLLDMEKNRLSLIEDLAKAEAKVSETLKEIRTSKKEVDKKLDEGYDNYLKNKEKKEGPSTPEKKADKKPNQMKSEGDDVGQQEKS